MLALLLALAMTRVNVAELDRFLESAARRRGGTIAIDARRDRSEVIFSISDTGPGIPEGELKNVFRPYWQAKKTAHLGAGLGPAIARGIVEAHGGKVWADNAPGGGAVFTFTIPLA